MAPLQLPIIIECPNPWEDRASRVINSLINESINERGFCNLMLTGGKTAGKLYRNAMLFDKLPVEKINIFFSDERCVPNEHIDSNYGSFVIQMAEANRPFLDVAHKIVVEGDDYEFMAREYAQKLPQIIDVLILSAGLDGHVASIFPGGSIFKKNNELVVLVESPFHSHRRITITPLLISKARKTILLAAGVERGIVLLKALQSDHNPSEFPVQLLMKGNSNWPIDSAAFEVIREVEKLNIYSAP
jgi:6-phosphogluconolactonase